MGIDLIIAIIAAATALTSIGATAAQNKKNRQNTLADWKATNEYNSPLAQMQRYSEAGLNPKLIYGQTNTAQPISTQKLEALPMNEVGKSMMQYFSAKQDVKSMAIQDQQVQNMQTLNDLNEVKIIGEIIKNNKGAFENAHMEEWMVLRMNDIMAKTAGTEASTDLAIANKKNVESQTELNRQALDLNARKYIDSHNNQLLNEKKFILQEKNYKLAQLKTQMLVLQTASNIAKNNATIALIKKQTEKTQQQIDDIVINRSYKGVQFGQEMYDWQRGLSKSSSYLLRQAFEQSDVVGGAAQGYYNVINMATNALRIVK